MNLFTVEDTPKTRQELTSLLAAEMQVIVVFEKWTLNSLSEGKR